MRHDFVEDQRGNVASAGSRRERAARVLGLLTQAPGIAVAAGRALTRS